MDDQIAYALQAVSSKLELLISNMSQCIRVNKLEIRDSSERMRMVWSPQGIGISGKKSVAIELSVVEKGSTSIRLLGPRAVSELLVVTYHDRQLDVAENYVGSAVLSLNHPKKRRTALVGVHPGSHDFGLFVGANRQLTPCTIEISLTSTREAFIRWRKYDDRRPTE